MCEDSAKLQAVLPRGAPKGHRRAKNPQLVVTKLTMSHSKAGLGLQEVGGMLSSGDLRHLCEYRFCICKMRIMVPTQLMAEEDEMA